MNNEILKRAAVRSMEIIGEASKKIPLEFKTRWDSIAWKNMSGMRDRLIHHYMGVDYAIVWDVMMYKIPELSVQINTALDQEEGNSK